MKEIKKLKLNKQTVANMDMIRAGKDYTGGDDNVTIITIGYDTVMTHCYCSGSCIITCNNYKTCHLCEAETNPSEVGVDTL